MTCSADFRRRASSGAFRSGNATTAHRLKPIVARFLRRPACPEPNSRRPACGVSSESEADVGPMGSRLPLEKCQSGPARPYHRCRKTVRRKDSTWGYRRGYFAPHGERNRAIAAGYIQKVGPSSATLRMLPDVSDSVCLCQVGIDRWSCSRKLSPSGWIWPKPSFKCTRKRSARR